MSAVPTALFTPAQVREMDARAFDRGVAEDALMERAAGHLARAITGLAGRAYGLRVGILCGRGNNGGDGLAAARRLADAGAKATVCVVDGVDALGGLPAEQLARLHRRGGRIADSPQEALAGAEIAVDCLLGTGAAGEPREPYRTAIAALEVERAQGAPVVACDVPSGVDATTGEVPGAAVTADVTLTLGAEKVGVRLWPARGYCGEIAVGDLGIVEPRDEPAAYALDDTDAGALLPPPEPLAHKRRRGRVLVVAGSAGMAGAGVLTARGAVEAGAGLVRLLGGERTRDAAAAAVPEALTGALDDPEPDPEAALRAVLARAEDADAVAVGPGRGTGPGVQALVHGLCERLELPLVLDADALTAVAASPDPAGRLAAYPGPALVLTPHEGELARLVGGPAPRHEAPGHARSWGATLVAKGPGTVVAAPDGRTWVTTAGTAALATGGTGDVLTGMVAAALAGGPDPARVAAAVHWHGRAGELAAAARHPAAVSAGSVADVVPVARCGLDPAPPTRRDAAGPHPRREAPRRPRA